MLLCIIKTSIHTLNGKSKNQTFGNNFSQPILKNQINDKLLTISQRKIQSINKLQDEGLIVEKANLLSVKLSENDEHKIKLPSQVADANKIKEDNLSVYYSKAINRYERQKSTLVRLKIRSTSTGLQPPDTNKNKDNITESKVAMGRKEPDNETQSKQINKTGRVSVCVNTDFNSGGMCLFQALDQRIKKSKLNRNITVKSQNHNGKQNCKQVNFLAPQKHDFLNENIHKFNIDLGEIMKFKRNQKSSMHT